MEISTPPGNSSRPLTREEIAGGGPYNPTVARTLLDQGVLAVNDLLDAKKQFEVKAIALLAVFVPSTAAALGVPLIVEAGFGPVWFLAGVLFAAASLGCVLALRERPYGTVGIDPRGWLSDRWLSAGDNAGPVDQERAARLHAMLAHDVGVQVEASEARNKEKARLIADATRFSWFATLAVVVAAVLEIWL